MYFLIMSMWPNVKLDTQVHETDRIVAIKTGKNASLLEAAEDCCVLQVGQISVREIS